MAKKTIELMKTDSLADIFSKEFKDRYLGDITVDFTTKDKFDLADKKLLKKEGILQLLMKADAENMLFLMEEVVALIPVLEAAKSTLPPLLKQKLTYMKQWKRSKEKIMAELVRQAHEEKAAALLAEAAFKSYAKNKKKTAPKKKAKVSKAAFAAASKKTTAKKVKK